MDSKKLKKIVEAIIFVSEEPISAKEISDVLSIDEDEIKEVITDLISDYRGRGIEIESIADGFRFTTSEDVSEYVKIFVQDRPIKLSKHLLEVLSIVAYKQPVTRKEILSIRGKNPDGAIKSLLEKGLIKVVGRKKTAGRPKLYGTTKEFLIHFGLSSIKDLPSLEEIDEQD
jgi:segregation and condensation protein B